MPEQEHRSQRTEKPTPRRLKKAREEGNVPRSTEVSGALVLVTFLLFAQFAGPSWLGDLKQFMTRSLVRLEAPGLTLDSVMQLFRSVSWTTALLLLPPLAAFSLAGVAGNLVQGPPPLTLKPLQPKWEKLSPVSNLKRVVSLRQWMEVLKSVLKMTLYSAVAYGAVRDAVVELRAPSPSPEGAFGLLVELARSVILRIAALAVGLALLDFLFKRYDYTRNLMMSKKEVRDELKEQEGDPMVRARIKQKQMAMARARMMADVPKATVVVTNPTHVAVALRYVQGETSAPKLLAKGRGLLALRIREIAQEHRVPVVEDPPLARAIYKSVPLGAMIPPALFQAVAEVLALVFQRRQGGASRRPGDGPRRGDGGRA